MSICQVYFLYIMNTLHNAGVTLMKLRVIDILKEKGKTKYWLYIRLGLSYQNFNKMIHNQTKSIKYDNLQALRSEERRVGKECRL